MSGWIGVDFDGTLAHYSGWNNGELGEPINLMLERVRAWLKNGQEVRIMTARVADSTFAADQRGKIEQWCLKYIGQIIPVTAMKDFGMIELWDDRCVRVIQNTGRRCCGDQP